MSYSLMTVETLGWMLIHSLWIIAAIAVLASVTMLLLRRRSANARYLAGCAALLLSAISLPVSLVFLADRDAASPPAKDAAPPLSISVDRSMDITSADGNPISIGWGEELQPQIALDSPLTDHAAPTSTPSVDPPFVERLRELVQPHLSKIVTGWFIGIVLLSIRPLVGWRHARRLRSTGIVDVSEEVQRLFGALVHRIGLTRTVRLVESQLVQIPSVVGAFKPVILLPATAVTGLTADQLQAVLAHELAHIRRHDYLINGLQTAIETLLFYHPAIWWLSRRVRVERENCCDDFVVTLLDNSAEYCKALVTIDRLRQDSPLPTLAMHATDGSLLARVRRLAGVETPPRFGNSPAIVMLAFVVVGTMLAWSLSYAQKEDAPPLPEESTTIEEATSLSADELHFQEVLPDPMPESETEKSVAKMLLVYHQDESRRAIQGLMVNDNGTTLIVSTPIATAPPNGIFPAIDEMFLELDGKPLIEADDLDFLREDLFMMRVQGEYASLEMPKITTVEVGDSLDAVTYGFVDGMRINHDAIKVKSLNASTDLYFVHALKRLSYDNLFQVDGVLREGTILFKEGKLVGIVLIGERFVDKNSNLADDNTSYVIPADRVAKFITDVREKRVHRDPEPQLQNDLKLENVVITKGDSLPLPTSPTEKSTAKLILGFWQDESRRAIQSLLITHNGKTIVISASPASIVPDGSRPAIDASFLEFDEKPPISAKYRDGNIELQYHIADGGFTALEMPEIADVESGDALSALTYDFVNGMRVQPNATTAFNTNASFQLPSPHSRDVKHYKNLIRVKGALREGTILFKDGKLAGIVLAGRRLNKMINDTLEGKESYVVPASHVLALINEAKAKIDADDAKKKNDEPETDDSGIIKSEIDPLPAAKQLSVQIDDGVARIGASKNIETKFVQSIIAGLQETGIEKFALKTGELSKKPDEAKMWLGIRIDGESAELSPSKEFPADALKAVIDALSKSGVKKVNFAVAEGEDKKPAATIQKDAAPKPREKRQVEPPSASPKPTARKHPDTPTGRLLDELAEQNASNNKFHEDPWCKTMMQIVEIGSDAVPELIAELDATDDDKTLRCLGFMLRAIGDKRAVPALIRAIPKTLRPPMSDYGLRAEDETIAAFMQKHDLSDRDEPLEYSFGRSMREIFGALHKLTGQSFDEETLNFVFLHGTERQQSMKRQIFYGTAQKWAGWWERNWKEHVQDEAYAKVNLPQFEPTTTPPPIKPNQRIKTVNAVSGLILDSYKTPKRNHVFYDFDTGRHAGLPDKWKNIDDVESHVDEIVAWANNEGYDMMGVDYVDPASGQSYYALRPISLQFWELGEEYWNFNSNDVAVGELRAKGTPAAGLLLHYDAEKEAFDPTATATFLFKTREGTPGLVFVGIEVKDDSLKPGGTSPANNERSPIGFSKGRRFGWTQFEELPDESKPSDETSETPPPAAAVPRAIQAAQFKPLMPRISVVDADSPYEEAAEVNSLGVPYEPDVKQVTRPVQDFALLKLPDRVAGEVVDKVTGKRIEGATVTFRFNPSIKLDHENADAVFTFRDVGQYQFDVPEVFRYREGQPHLSFNVERIVEHPDYQPLAHSTMSFGSLAQITLADHINRWFQRIELKPGVEVTGQVLDFDRQPAKGIRVFSGRDRRGWNNGCLHETTTDGSGRFRLFVPEKTGRSRGRIYVIPDHASAVSRAISPEFGEQEVFQLRRGTRLHGKVVDVDGKGVPGIIVRANGGERIPWRYAVTDSKGEYLMPPLQYGTYNIELIDQGQVPGSPHRGSPLPDVYANQKLTLSKHAPIEQRLDFTPGESVKVTARFTNSDGTPATGYSFRVFGVANGAHWFGTLTDVPGEPGMLSVRVPKGIRQLRVEDDQLVIDRVFRHDENAYQVRIKRILNNASEPTGNWFVQVNEDDDSLRIERWKPAQIRVRAVVDGEPFDLSAIKGGVFAHAASPDLVQQLGINSNSLSWSFVRDGFWHHPVHPGVDFVVGIKAPGFASWQKTVKLDEGEIREIDVPLERIVDRSVERRVTE